MDSRGERAQERMRIRNSWMYSAFNAVFALVFAGIIVLAIFFNVNTQYRFNGLLLAALAAGGTAVVLLLFRLFSVLSAPGRRAEICAVAALFVLFAALQVYVGWYMRAELTDAWDYGVAAGAARGWALNGDAPGEYFGLFTGNQGIYVFYCLYFSFFSMLGITDFAVPMLALNVLAIDGALLLLYFAARRMFGAVKAIFILLAAFVTLPFLLYAPIAYTDTLCLPIPIGMVLMWLKVRALWREGQVRPAVRRFCLIAALAGAGAWLKPSVVIVFAAILLDLVIFLCGRGRLRMLLAGVCVTALMWAGGVSCIRALPMLPSYDYSKSVPFTHWVMMGLKGSGGYNEDDYLLTLEAPDKAARLELGAEEIGQRVADMGPVGFARHLGDKLSYTYGDGLYTAQEMLAVGSERTSFLHELFVNSGSFYPQVAYAAFAVQAAMLICMAAAAVKAVRRRNHALTFVRVALFGLTLFLLIWETQARQLVSFLPLFLLCALEAIPTPMLALQRVRARQAAAGLDAVVASAFGREDAAETGFAAPSEEAHGAELDAPLAAGDSTVDWASAARQGEAVQPASERRPLAWDGAEPAPREQEAPPVIPTEPAPREQEAPPEILPEPVPREQEALPEILPEPARSDGEPYAPAPVSEDVWGDVAPAAAPWGGAAAPQGAQPTVWDDV